VPTLLVHHGKVVEANLRKEHLSRDDLLANLRTQGVFNLGEVQEAILETSGKLSILHSASTPDLKKKS
jgi:uncharacterized membrane protein YcaP (DUF421 family)